jgi:8-oxo-dGTP pyrophosphatase MutT (NUDIX family)
MIARKISNAGIILNVKCKTGETKILVVQLVGGKWTNPGGKVEMGEDAFRAAKREFEEETGLELPRIRNIVSKDIHHGDGSITRLYCGYTDLPEDYFALNKNGSHYNGETIDLKLYTYEEIMAHKKKYKGYFIKSLINVHADGLAGGYVSQQYQNKNTLYKHKYEKYSQKSQNIIDLI